MTMAPTRHEKVTAHAAHLLDAFLGLRGKYAMLEPMLFDGATIARWGAGKRSHGFQIIQGALLMSCVLDVGKLTFDKDERTPSLVRLESALGDEHLLDVLREEFAVWHLAPTSGEREDVIAILQTAERREEAKRR